MTAQATVTIPYNEFQSIQEAKRKAEQEAANLRQQITEKKIEVSDQATLTVARAAIEVVRFAVGSMPPESIKGWPSAALKKISQHLMSLPDASTDDTELAITLTSFAAECERLEQYRQGRSGNTGDVVNTVIVAQ